MNETHNIPVYEVKGISLEQAILLIASEHEKEKQHTKNQRSECFSCVPNGASSPQGWTVVTLDL